MGIASKTHWAGVFLLFVSAMLLLFATLSAPIINRNSLLRVTLTNSTMIRRSSVSFGTFGFCILDVPPNNSQQDWCIRTHIGYSPAEAIAEIDHAPVSDIVSGTSDGLTGVMVLHSIACAVAFVALIVSLAAGIIGSLAGAMIALLAWILTLIAMAADFSMWGVLRHHINRDGSGSHAHFGSAIWCVLASFVTLFVGILVVLFTCLKIRKEKKGGEPTVPIDQQARKKRFGLF